MATLADARLSKTALRTLSPGMNKDPEVRQLPGELRGAVRQSLSRGLERFRRAADHVAAVARSGIYALFFPISSEKTLTDL